MLRGSQARLMAALAAVALFWLLAPGLLHAAQDEANPPPAWRCLPEETVAAVRIPNGKAFVDAVRKNTQLGAVLFNEQRIRRVTMLIMQQDAAAWAKVRAEMAKYGLAPKDFPQFLAGESGFALVLDRGQGAAPSPMGLSWLEPGEDLATRAVAAIGKAIEDLDDEEHPVKRVDIQIDGRPILQLTVPIVTADVDIPALDLPGSVDALPPQQQAGENGKEKVEYFRVLVGRIGPRLLLANTFNSAAGADGGDDAKRLTAVFASFLAAHHGGEGGFVARVSATGGVADALPRGGVAWLELLADLAPLVKMADPNTNPMAANIIKVLGVEHAGTVALRSTLDGNIMRTGFFLGLPAPREGVVSFLDHPQLQPEPPAWIPASVIGYNHTSLDLGQWYWEIKRLAVREFGPAVQQGFQMAETQVQRLAQVDLATLLSSLGNQHIVLSYEPKFAAEADAANPLAMQSNPQIAIVWQVKDEGLWNRTLQAIGPWAQMAGDSLQFTQEQGFSGWRFNQEPYEGGLFLGKGHLVFALGQGVLEQTLSTLNNPPGGTDALRSGDAYARAKAMIPLQPGTGFQLVDGRRYGKIMKKTIDSSIDQWLTISELVQTGEDAAAIGPMRAMVKQLRQLLPSEEEFESIFGVEASYTLSNQHGLVGQSASELPPPK